MSEHVDEAVQQYVITGLSIDGVRLTMGSQHPERTPIGPFDSREAAWDYARQMQVRHGSGGGSADVSPLHAPHIFPPTPSPDDLPRVAGEGGGGL